MAAPRRCPSIRVFYDRTTNCVQAKPDNVLNQGTRYLLFVSNRVRAADGTTIVADDAFKSCALGGGTPYCAALKRALTSGPREARSVSIAGASIFTTMSATDWLQKARARLYATPFLPAALPAGDKSVFNVAELQSFVWLPQTNINELPQKPITVPLPILDGVEKIAFGLYLSPNYIQPDGPMPGTIAVTPTGGAIQAPVRFRVSTHHFRQATSRSRTTSSCRTRAARLRKSLSSSTRMAPATVSSAHPPRSRQRSRRRDSRRWPLIWSVTDTVP